MMKRTLDLCGSIVGLCLASPVLVPVLLLIWMQDWHSPLYIAPRVGRHGSPFRMVKVRSMKIGADQVGVDSTSAQDPRITAVGRFVRAYKLDELGQLWNVLLGQMSLVGPRPNVPRETALYTAAEQSLLSVLPGMTDFASIVFADEGDILSTCGDPDIGYHQLIRPWKSRLGLFYVQHCTVWLDVQLIVLTIVAILSRASALAAVQKILRRVQAPSELITIAGRQVALVPMPPPGANTVVTTRGAA